MISINSCVSSVGNEADVYNLDDEWVVVDKTQEKTVIMNETAFMLWDIVRSTKGITMKDICNKMFDEFPEVDESRLQEDILEALNLMLQESLLYEV